MCSLQNSTGVRGDGRIPAALLRSDAALHKSWSYCSLNIVYRAVRLKRSVVRRRHDVEHLHAGGADVNDRIGLISLSNLCAIHYCPPFLSSQACSSSSGITISCRSISFSIFSRSRSHTCSHRSDISILATQHRSHYLHTRPIPMNQREQILLRIRFASFYASMWLREYPKGRQSKGDVQPAVHDLLWWDGQRGRVEIDDRIMPIQCVTYAHR